MLYNDVPESCKWNDTEYQQFIASDLSGTNYARVGTVGNQSMGCLVFDLGFRVRALKIQDSRFSFRKITAKNGSVQQVET